MLRPPITTNKVLRPYLLSLAHKFSVGFDYDCKVTFNGGNGGLTKFRNMPIPHVGICEKVIFSSFMVIPMFTMFQALDNCQNNYS